MGTVTPAGRGVPAFPEKSVFSSNVQDLAQKVLKALPEAQHPASAIIQERLEEPTLDEVAAGIPGASLPRIREEAEIKGQAVISGAKQAKESVRKTLRGGGLGERVVTKGDGGSSEKVKKLFPKV